MDQTGVSQKSCKKKGWDYSNAAFAAIVSICISLVVGFIALTISMVVMRGLPRLWESISSAEIIYALKLSLSTSVTATFLCVVFALPVSYGMSRMDFRGKGIISAVLGIPISLPPIVSGVALLTFFGTTAFGKLLSGWGIDFIFTAKGIILAQFFVNVPYMTRILRSTFNDIDPRMEHVARSLGCSRFEAFWRVSVPLAKNGLAASVIITWSKALGEFGSVLMLAGATRMKTETLPASIFLNISCGELDLAMASAAILIIISLSAMIIFELLCGKNRIRISRNY